MKPSGLPSRSPVSDQTTHPQTHTLTVNILSAIISYILVSCFFFFVSLGKAVWVPVHLSGFHSFILGSNQYGLLAAAEGENDFFQMANPPKTPERNSTSASDLLWMLLSSDRKMIGGTWGGRDWTLHFLSLREGEVTLVLTISPQWGLSALWLPCEVYFPLPVLLNLSLT